jgi:hypothetical protein
LVAAKSTATHGRYSGTLHSAFVCQEVLARNTTETTLEIRTTDGERVSSAVLPQLSAGHQLTPDGRLVYVLTGGGERTDAGILRRLVAIDPSEGKTWEVGTSTSALPSVDDEYVAYFTNTR